MNPIRLPLDAAAMLALMVTMMLPIQALHANGEGWLDCDSVCYVTSYLPINDTVACLDDLDSYSCAALTVVDTCTMAQYLSSQVLANGADSVTTCQATTAQGVGPDGALRIYGISTSGLVASDYFVETEQGLTLTQYKNDIAILEGEVAAVNDPDQRFEVFIVYEDRVDGSDWTGGYKHAMGCTPPTDTWDIYTMKPDQSHLLGKGSLAGSLIRVTHAPSSQYFGFQVGEGANDHNCAYGAGGWFSWEGTVCGTELAGAMGDVIVDLECSTDFDPCNARSKAYFSAYVEDCGVWQHEFDIVRHDDTAPVIDGVPGDVVQDCSLPIEVPTGVTVSDDCPEPGYPTLAFEGTVEVEAHEGHCRTFQQRWTAEDACGNESEAVRHIHTTDDIAPQMVGDEIVEMECDEWPGGNEPPLEVLIQAGIIDVDENCLMDTVLIDYGVMSGGCYYDHIMTYTPIDYCGNVGDSFYQIVVIHDTTPPILVGVPADTSVSCTTDPSLVDSLPTAIDNCDPEVEKNYEENTLDDGDGCDETFIIERIFIASDCGYNHTRDTQYVHVVDTAAPVIVLELPESVVLEGCFADLDLSLEALGDATASASDDCGEVTLVTTMVETVVEVCTDGDGNEGGGILLQRTWTATAADCAGNAATTIGTQTIEVQDNSAPVLDAAPVVEYTCAAWLDGLDGEEAMAAGLLTASDDCLLDSVAVEVLGQLSGSCAGTFEVMYTAVDACGNSSSASQIIELNDDVPPAFTSVPADGTLDCDGVPAPYMEGEAEAEDACGNVEITASDELLVEDGCTGTGVWQRTLTATDDCGNIAQHVQLFQREDTTVPTIISQPDDVTVSCGLPPFDPATVTATDDCDDAPVVSHVDDTVAQSCPHTFTVERHILATDCAGNVGEAIQVIEVEDVTPPDLISTGILVTLPCTDWTCDIDALVEAGFISATDDCGEVDISVQCFAMSGGCVEPNGTYTLQYTATDACGNTSNAQQILTLLDEEAPQLTLTCPSDITIELDEECGYVLGDPSSDAPWGEPSGSATDNCDAMPAFAFSHEDAPATQSCGDGGSITIMRTHTLTATDACGNEGTASCFQTITFADVTGPVLDVEPPLPANLLQCLADTDTTTAALGWPVVTAADACGGEVGVVITYDDVVTYSCEGDDAETEGSATLDRTFTIVATDCVGNVTTSITTQAINFFDFSAPVVGLTCPSDTVLEADPDCLVDLDPAQLGMPGVDATDNCDTDVSFTLSHSDSESAGACAGERTVVRTFTVTATDDCENTITTTCAQTITVLDVIAPTVFLTCPEDATIDLDEDCGWDGDAGTPAVVAADGCDPDPLVEVSFLDHDTVLLCSDADGLQEGSFSFVRTWTAVVTDDCGNATILSCDQAIQLMDVTAPGNHTIEILSTDTLFLDADCLADLDPAVDPETGAEDGCDSEVEMGLGFSDDPAVYEMLADEVSLEIDTLPLSGVAGATTYRLFVQLNNPGDCLSAVVGEDFDATWITSTAPFFQHPLGGVTPEAIDPILFTLYPDLEQDSWVTVGIDGPPDAAADQGGLQIVESTSWVSSFEAGNSIAMNSTYGDGWFSLPTNSNGIPDEDDRVLLAQLTTTGHISGQLYLQVLEGGVGGNAAQYALTFGNACTDEDGQQEGSYTFVRTWLSTATDDCGNTSEVSSFQNIAVLDTTAPQWTNTCGLTNGEVVTMPCAGEGILDFDPHPDPCLVEAVDNCDTEVGIARFDDVDDDAPTGEACNTCGPSDPAPLDGGLTCDGEESETLRLFNFNGEASSSFILEATEISRLSVGCDSSLAVTLHLTDGEGGGFLFEADYEGGLDWDAWNGDGHPGAPLVEGTYKKDCAEVYPGVPVWLDWHYFVMTGGNLTGTGTYAGSDLVLAHQPANAYFGFQVGLGANNKNEAYGASGWFFWEGELVVDGVSQGNMASSGDIFVDLDCCLPWEAEHDYVAQDDCGNGITFEYTVVNTGETDDEGAGLSGGSQHQGGPAVIGGGPVDKQPFSILGLMPNPTSDLAQLQFEVSEAQRLTIRLHTMDGAFLDDIFDGTVQPGAIYQVDIEAGSLSSGLYQLRISGGVHSEVRKLLVTE